MNAADPARDPRPARLRAVPDEPEPARHRPGHRVDDLFERQRTASEHLPDPSMLIVNLTRYTVEILAGVRELDQISRWLDPDAYERLHQSLRVPAMTLRIGGKPPTWPRFRLGRTTVGRPADGVIECVTVIHRDPPARSGAIALRLIGIDGRWRATRIDPIFLR